jgi:cytoskeletal protein RodZ
MAGCLQQLWPKSRTGYWRIFVKTRIKTLSFLAALAFAMICWGSTLNAQNAPSTSPDRQAQQPSSSPDTTPPQSTPDAQAPSSQSPSQTPDTTAPPPSSRTPDSGAQGSASDSGTAAGTQTFSGTVVKQGDKYVLKDDSGKTYDIDHQDEVKKFEGKRVRVQGTLDPSTNKIMVK